MKTLTPAVAPRGGARERLIDAAGEIFGELGYHGATVRDITKKAGVNLAAINYYFRDKEELYWEVLRHAVKAALASDAPVAADRSPEEQLHAFIEDFLRHMLDPKRPEWHGKLISREMSSPTRLLDILVETDIRPKRDLLQKIVETISKSPLSENQLSLCCASIMGQCVHYRHSMPVLERLYPDLLKGEPPIEMLAAHITAFSLAGIRGLNSKTA